MAVRSDKRLIYETPAQIEPAEGSYSTAQRWGALRKSWKGYVIALRNGEAEKAKMYAERINRLQKSLGIEITHFRLVVQDGVLRSE